MTLHLIFFADSDSDSESSDPDYSNEGGFDAGDKLNSPIQPVSEHDDSQPDRPAQDEDDDFDEPYCSDDGPDWDVGPDGPFNTLSSHLTKLDSLTARGCADKFFQVHSARWAPLMPRPGDYLHSARAGGIDARETRKRKASDITRSMAESHAFCSAANLSQSRCDQFMQTFTNVNIFFCLRFKYFALLFAVELCAEVGGDSVTGQVRSKRCPVSFVSRLEPDGEGSYASGLGC